MHNTFLLRKGMINCHFNKKDAKKECFLNFYGFLKVTPQ